MNAGQSAALEPAAAQFPRYQAAALGFPEYWYPAFFSGQVSNRPIARRLLGQQILFVRDNGRVYALHDRCAHRGVPLSLEPRREFPGTISCCFHGWTYDLASGRLVAAITDGPDSPICGKVAIRTYPVEERAGMVWVYMGTGDPPPVEVDIPADMLATDAVVLGLVGERRGNWRYAVETGIDEGHGKYLHRTSPWMFFRELPTWTRVHMAPSEDGQWLVRCADEVGYETEFPGLGRWPRDTYFLGMKKFWKLRNRHAQHVGVRLPGQLRVRQLTWTDYELWVPVDEDHHLAVMVAVAHATGLEALLFRLQYWAFIRPIYYGHLNGKQDQMVISAMQTPPERLYRPDVSVTAWRRLCEEHARGAKLSHTASSRAESLPRR